MAYGPKRSSYRAKAPARGGRRMASKSSNGSRRSGNAGGRGPQTIKIVLQTVAASPVAAPFGQQVPEALKRSKF